MAQTENWYVTRDGELLFTGNSEDACWRWLHHHHSGSIDNAIKNEGYRILPPEWARQIRTRPEQS